MHLFESVREQRQHPVIAVVEHDHQESLAGTRRANVGIKLLPLMLSGRN